MKEGKGAGAKRRSTTAKYDPGVDAPTKRVAVGEAALEKGLRTALAPSLLLVNAIGSGGMARVFLAREPALRRLVAVKVLSGDLAADPDARKRFEREAQAVASLSHPNIVAIHGVGELEDGTPYFVMQYVEGRSLSARVEQDGPLGVTEARRVLGEVAAALAAAHKQGIIHRDIKPANILYEDASGRAMVSDFGIAAMKAPEAPVATRLTATGMVVGTPQYMSPEQLLAEPVGEKTDVYSLGLLAHEILAGTGPFRGTTPQELIAAHLRDTPARLSTRRPDVDPELDEIIARCLEKDASRRPTADEIARRFAPGGSALLEWPPPGLEALHGRARHLSSPFLLGSALITGALLVMIAAGPRMNAVSASMLTLLLFLAAGLGGIALVVAMRRTVRLGRLMAAAIREGYGWITVAETLSDVRGDTGNIVTASREYASLAPRERDSFRRARVAREGAFLFAGIVAVPLLVAVIVVGPALRLGLGFTWWGLAPVVLVATAIALGERERRRFAAQRRRRSLATPGDLTALVTCWNDCYESARAGQKTGRGPRVAPWLGRLGLGAGGVLVALGIVLLVPLILIGVFGPNFWSVMLPQFANVRSRVVLAEVVRPYTLEKDASITPLEAGRALRTLLASMGDTARTSVPEHPAGALLGRAPWADSLPAGLFRTARTGRQFTGLPDATRIVKLARAGLTPGELAYLERIARAPHWAALETFARASAYDYFGARYPLPFRWTSEFEMPVPRFTAVRELAHASASRAAYHLASGRRDSAEHALRVGVSTALLLVDEGSTVLEALIGAVSATTARIAMVDLFEATGDPRGAAIQARVNALAARAELADQREPQPMLPGVDRGDALALRTAALRAANDPGEMRGVRLEMLAMLSRAPCTNLRELLFGPGAEIQSAFEAARTGWARYPSDQAMLDLVANSALEPQTFSASGPMPITLRAARLASRATGNHRFAACTSVLLQWL